MCVCVYVQKNRSHNRFSHFRLVISLHALKELWNSSVWTQCCSVLLHWEECLVPAMGHPSPRRTLQNVTCSLSFSMSHRFPRAADGLEPGSEQLVQTTLNKTLFFLLSCSFFMVDFVPTGHTLSGEACQHRSAPHAAFNGVENTVEEYQAADRHQTHDTWRKIRFSTKNSDCHLF